MLQDIDQIQRQGAEDFMAYYDFVCARHESVPVPAVKMNLDKGMLDFNADRLKLTDWPPVLASIAINKHLHHIAISSTYHTSLGGGDVDRRYCRPGFKKKIPPIRSKDMTFKLCKSLKECLSVSSNLKSLQLHGLPLRERDLITLTKGLAKSTSLENLSLAKCPISDEGLEVICQSVKYSSSIRTIDFTGCSLTWRGAEHMANIIKHQGMQRHGTAWAESLRYRHPHFEAMGGLRRITLNCNTLIGDRGAAALASELAEDLWVKAIDLQRCGLSSEGVRRLLEALKTNSSLCILDVRSNPLVDNVLIKTTIEKVLMNAGEQTAEYHWIKPAATEPQRAPGPKKPSLPRAARRTAPFRTGTSGGLSSGVARAQKSYSRSSYVPWRAAARAGRQRGLPPGITVTHQSFQGAATVKVTVDSGSEGEEEEDVEVEERQSLKDQDRVTGRQFERVQMELRECRLRLAEEHRARLKAESRLMEYELENARLRDAYQSLSEVLSATGSGPPAVSVLEDEAVLESIERSFTKFHAFLDLLKDAGLGQLASMAGIENSDFKPLGRPQLSSTVQTHVDGAGSLIGQELQTKDDAFSLVNRVPSLPGGPAENPIPRPASSVRESLLDADKMLDMTFNQALGSAIESPYSKPYNQHNSGSAHSLCSQKAYSKVSLGETFQTQQSKDKSKSNSEQSDSSRKSHASYSNWSNGKLSERSSVSDIKSEKAESLGSVGSRNREKWRLGTIG